MRIPGILRAALAVTLALGLGAAPPQPVTPVPAPVPAAVPPADLVPATALAHRVEKLKRAVLSGDPGSLQAATRDVDLLRRNYGTLDVMPLVEAMVLWARQLGDQGHAELGLRALQAVEPWAPHHPLLLGSRVILMRQEGFRGYVGSLPDVMELNTLRLSHPTHRWLWAVQHLAWLRFMATMLLWGWALTLGLRYRHVFRNLWEEPLARKGYSPRAAALMGAFLLALPVLLGLDPSVSAMLWLFLLAPFLSVMEVRCTVLVILLQLVNPALALLEPGAGKEPPPSVVALQLQPQVNSLDELGAKRLPPLDRDFLRGWRQLQHQDWAGAEVTFQGLAGKHPNQAEVLNNLGVARFQAGNHEGALKDFDEAFKLAPSAVEVLLNQSVLAFERLDSVVGIGKQNEARSQSPEAFARIMTVSQSLREQRTYAMPLPDTPERVKALESAVGGEDAPAPGLGGFKLAFCLLLPLAAAGAFWMRLKRSIKDAHPTQCVRCGEPFHTTDSPDTEVCSKCHHLFVLKDGLHGDSRIKKIDEVSAFQDAQRWIHHTLILLMPGADLCFLGETREGFQEFVFLCFALGIVLATGRTVRYPGEILADPASTWLPVGLVLLGVLFLRSWLKLLPRRS